MKVSSTDKFGQLPLLAGITIVFLLLALATVSVRSPRVFQSAQSVQKPQVNNGVSNKNLNSQVPNSAHFLTVDQPEDNFVAPQPTLTVRGKTSAGSTVVVVSGDETQFTEVGSNGDFGVNINLQEGATSVEVTAFAQNGEEKNVSREVFYTTETL